MPNTLYITSNSKEWKVEIDEKGNEKYEVKIGGKARTVEIKEAGEGLFHLLIDGKPLTISLSLTKGGCEVSSKEGQFVLSITRVPHKWLNETSDLKGKTIDIVRSPMPGRILKIFVKEGDRVDKNSVLLTLEAMKMENEIRSPVKGVVKKLYVKENMPVEGKVKLVEIEEK